MKIFYYAWLLKVHDDGSIEGTKKELNLNGIFSKWYCEFLHNNSNNDKDMSTIWPTWVSSYGSQLSFCATPIRFPERSQIFRRRQERAINRRPEKLMNNTRRRESGHCDGDRWYPFISMSPSGTQLPRTESLTSPGTFRGERSLPLTTCIMNVCHIRRLISVCRPRRHAEMFATTPARLRYRFPMLAQLSLYLVLLLALHRCGLMESSAHPHQHAPLIFHLMYISAIFDNTHHQVNNINFRQCMCIFRWNK